MEGSSGLFNNIAGGLPLKSAFLTNRNPNLDVRDEPDVHMQGGFVSTFFRVWPQIWHRHLVDRIKR